MSKIHNLCFIWRTKDQLKTKDQRLGGQVKVEQSYLLYKFCLHCKILHCIMKTGKKEEIYQTWQEHNSIKRLWFVIVTMVMWPRKCNYSISGQVGTNALRVSWVCLCLWDRFYSCLQIYLKRAVWRGVSYTGVLICTNCKHTYYM